jgi:dTDP-4-amino-4,6-dideoxygalactose transaminase
MFIANPDSFLLPSYRIGAFVTSAITRNTQIEDVWADTARAYFDQRFGAGNWLLTLNGREAIALAMDLLALPADKTVSILTPSNNLYISGCVTSTLNKYCLWDRQATENTSAYFVNHEFGYLYPAIKELVEKGLPVIEDCCTTFFSQDAAKKIGLYGNFSVFSFPKFFSIQIGGLLVGKGVGSNLELQKKIAISKEEAHYVLKVVGYELKEEANILQKRSRLHQYASEQFKQLGFSLRFQTQAGEVPSVLLLNNHQIIKNLPSFKDYLYAQGLQNSVFYGEDAFFIPCHQNLTEVDIDYFKFVTEEYIKRQE